MMFAIFGLNIYMFLKIKGVDLICDDGVACEIISSVKTLSEPL